MRPNTVSYVVVATAACLLGCSGRPHPGREGASVTQSALLSSGSFTFNVPLPPGTAMGSVVLGSNSSIFLGNRVQVLVEGSTTARSTISNAGTGTVTAQTDVTMQDDIWSRGNVFLADRASVAGGITTAGTLTRQNNVTVGGSIFEHQTLTPAAASWTVNFPASSTNVQLQPGQTRTLAPGGYATVSVAANATLTLSTGTYYFDQLSNEPSGTIRLTGNGPFNIYVKTSFSAKGPILLPASPTPPTLLVGVAGTSDVFVQTEFDGTLVAMNANVTLAAIGTSTHHGAFFGRSLTLQADVKVEHRSRCIFAPFAYGVPQSDLSAPKCSDGTAPVGCRAFDCDAGVDAGRWLAMPACPGSYPACTQACPSSGCNLSKQSPGRSGDIATCSCGCTDPASGPPLVVSATGCVPPSGGTAVCSSLCGSIVDPCGGAAGCSIGSCTSSASPVTVMAAACNPSENPRAPVTAVADWSAAVNSNASQMTLTVGASQTRVPISGTIKFNATADRIELVSIDLAGASFTFFGRNVSVPQARLLSRASGTRSAPDPDNPSGPTTISFATGRTLFGLSGTVGGTPNAMQVLNTAPITGTFNPGAGTIALAGHFVAGTRSADLTVSANINNRPPQARTNGNQTVVCTGGRSGSALVDGSTSSDPDGVISRYQWLATNAALVRPTEPVATATTATATLKLPLGQNRVVLRVYDDKLATSMATATVTVVDTTPPALTSPGNVVVFVGEGSSAIVDLGFPGVADACDPRPAVRAVWLLDGETTVNQPIPDPKHATFPLGGHTVRWFVTDAGGNTATVDQFVDINAGSGVDVPPTLQAPPTCPDPPLTSSTPVPLDVRVCVFGRMNLTTNTREGTAAWASCSTDQCVIDNLNSVFADARALWSDTVALNVVGFKVIADPCPPGYTDSSCISSCGGPTTFLQNNYGDMCNFDAGSSAPPGYEYGQAVKWCQQAWQFQPRLGGTAFDQCQRGLVAVIGNKVVSGTFCAFGNHGSPREADPQGDNVPLFACDDPNKINNNDQGAYLTFPQTETSCFQHALAHELGHALGMHHGDGVDNDCNGVWDYTCDQPEFNAFDCMNGSFSLMCDLSDSTVLTNLQKNRVRVFASRTPTTNGAQTPGQNCGTVVPPPVPGDVGHVTVTVDTGGCGGGGGCLIGATAPIETSVLLLALGLLTLTLRRRR